MSSKEKSGQLVRALRKAVTTCHSELATINEIGVVEKLCILHKIVKYKRVNFERYTSDMSNYKMIVMDMDDTLINSENKVSKKKIT